MRHLPQIQKSGGDRMCSACSCFGSCCNGNWQKVTPYSGFKVNLCSSCLYMMCDFKMFSFLHLKKIYDVWLGGYFSLHHMGYFDGIWLSTHEKSST